MNKIYTRESKKIQPRRLPDIFSQWLIIFIKKFSHLLGVYIIYDKLRDFM